MKLSKNQSDLLRELRSNILKNESALYECLKTYESHSTIADEIERSISAIDGVEDEFTNINQPPYEINLATYFPLNLPLYSLILFAVIPSLLCKHIYVRVPSQMHATLSKIIDLIALHDLYPNIHLLDVSRAVFNTIYVSQSSVVLFTGRYENAEIIRQQCADTLFIYNGSGINPALVLPDAEIPYAVDKIYEMRTFNSGQDCAGTDVIFVHDSVCDQFVERLLAKVKRTKVGYYDNESTVVGPIMRLEYVKELSEYLEGIDEHIVWRGNIDFDQQIVEPTVILRDSSHDIDDFHEFFGPVFNIVRYCTDNDLKKYTLHQKFQERSMYLSYFGTHDNISEISPKTINLQNQIINDVEQGNDPYGGYGSHANYVSFNQASAVRPVLISREIDHFFKYYTVS